MTTMAAETPQLPMVEGQYRQALKRLGFRLALIVSISGVAQFLNHWIG